MVVNRFLFEESFKVLSPAHWTLFFIKFKHESQLHVFKWSLHGGDKVNISCWACFFSLSWVLFPPYMIGWHLLLHNGLLLSGSVFSMLFPTEIERYMAELVPPTRGGLFWRDGIRPPSRARHGTKVLHGTWMRIMINDGLLCRLLLLIKTKKNNFTV